MQKKRNRTWYSVWRCSWSVLLVPAFVTTLVCASHAQETALLKASVAEKEEVCRYTRFSADGRFILGASDSHVTIWEAATRKEVAVFESDSQFTWYELAPAAMNADGTIVAYCGEDVLNIAEIKTKKVLREIAVPDGYSVCGLALTADGKLLACTDSYGMVRLFDTATGRETAAFDAYDAKNDDKIYAMRFLPDGRRLVTGGEDESPNPMSLRIWDVATGKLITGSRWQRRAVKSIAVSGDGKTIACAGDPDYEKGKVYHFDGEQLAVAATLPERFRRVSLSRDGSVLCGTKVSSGSGIIHVVDLDTNSSIGLTGTNPTSVSLHPDGKTLAVTCDAVYWRGPYVHLWDLAAAHRTLAPAIIRRVAKRDYGDYGMCIERVRFVADGKYLAFAADHSRMLSLWSIEKDAPVCALGESITKKIFGKAESVDFAPSALGLIVARNMVYQWTPLRNNLEGFSPVNKDNLGLGYYRRLLSVSDEDAETGRYSSDGSLKALVTRTRALVLDDQDNVVLKMSSKRTWYGESCAVSRDGRWLALSGGGSSLTLIDVKSGEEMMASGDLGGIFRFSPCGKYLFGNGGSGRYGGAVWRMEVATGEVDLPFMQHNGVGNCGAADLAVSQKAPVLAVAAGSVIRLWDYNTGRLLVTLEGHEHPVTAVAFASDGKTLASGDKEGYMCLWKLTEDLLSRADESPEPSKASADTPPSSPAAWPSHPKTIETSRGVSVIVAPLKPVTRCDVIAALQEAIEQVKKADSD